MRSKASQRIRSILGYPSPKTMSSRQRRIYRSLKRAYTRAGSPEAKAALLFNVVAQRFELTKAATQKVVV